MVAAAVIGGAIIGVAGSAYAGSQAAGATNDATNASIAAQKEALAQQSALSKPYRDLGTGNIQTYQNLLTGGGQQQPLSYDQWLAQNPQPGGAGAQPGGERFRTGPGGMLIPSNRGGPAGAGDTSSHAAYDKYVAGFKPSGNTIEQTLESLPGYQFTRDQGIEAAKRSSGAGGLNLTGNQVAAVEQYGAGLADQTYGERLQQLLQPIQLGQAAAAGQAANVGNAANNISGALINQGNTQAGIDANTIAGITRAGSTGINNYMTYQTLQGLNNPGSGVGGGGGVPTYAPLPAPDPITTSV